jgi:hypothetical protein
MENFVFCPPTPLNYGNVATRINSLLVWTKVFKHSFNTSDNNKFITLLLSISPSTATYTEWHIPDACIETTDYPDDEHEVAQNM